MFWPEEIFSIDEPSDTGVLAMKKTRNLDCYRARNIEIDDYELCYDCYYKCNNIAIRCEGYLFCFKHGCPAQYCAFKMRSELAASYAMAKEYEREQSFKLRNAEFRREIKEYRKYHNRQLRTCYREYTAVYQETWPEEKFETTTPVINEFKTRGGYTYTKHQVLLQQARYITEQKVRMRRVVPIKKRDDDIEFLNEQIRLKQGHTYVEDGQQKVLRDLRNCYKRGTVMEFGRKYDLTQPWQAEKLARKVEVFWRRQLEEKGAKSVVRTISPWMKRPHRLHLLKLMKYNGSALCSLVLDSSRMKAGEREFNAFLKAQKQGYADFLIPMAGAAIASVLLSRVPDIVTKLVVRKTVSAMPELMQHVLNTIWDAFSKKWDSFVDRMPKVAEGLPLLWAALRTFVAVFIFCWLIVKLGYTCSAEALHAFFGLTVGFTVSLAFIGAVQRCLANATNLGQPGEIHVEQQGDEFGIRLGDLFSEFSKSFTKENVAKTFVGLGERIPKFVSLLRALEWIFERIPVFACWMYYCITGKSFPVSTLECNLVSLIQSIDGYKANCDALGGFHASFNTDPTSFDQCKLLCTQFSSMTRNMNNLATTVHPCISRDFNNRARTIVAMETALKLFEVTARKRLTTTWCSLVGGKAIGKSTQTEVLQKAVYEKVHQLHPDDVRYQAPFGENSVFHYQPKDEYFDGYAHQVLVSLEEVFQQAAVEEKLPQTMFIQQMISSQPMPLLVADMDRKGAMYMDSHFLFTTRNKFFQRNLGIEEPDALFSRQHVCAKLIPCDGSAHNLAQMIVECDVHRRYLLLDPMAQNETPFPVMIDQQLLSLVTTEQLVSVIVAWHEHFRTLVKMPLPVLNIPPATVAVVAARGRFNVQMQCNDKPCDGSCLPKDHQELEFPVPQGPPERILQEEDPDPPSRCVERVAQDYRDSVKVAAGEIFSDDARVRSKMYDPNLQVRQLSASDSFCIMRQQLIRVSKRPGSEVDKLLSGCCPLFSRDYLPEGLEFTKFQVDCAMVVISELKRTDSEWWGFHDFRMLFPGSFMGDYPKGKLLCIFLKEIFVPGAESKRTFISRLTTHFGYSSPTTNQVHAAIFISRLVLIASSASLFIAAIVLLIRQFLPSNYSETQSGTFGHGVQTRGGAVMQIKRPIVVPGRIVRQSGEDVENKIMNNVFSFDFGGIGNYGLCIGGNLYVTTTHSFEKLLKNNELQLQIGPGFESTHQSWMGFQIENTWVLEDKPGLTFFKLPTGPARPEIMKHFVDVRVRDCPIRRVVKTYSKDPNAKLTVVLDRHTTDHWRWGKGQFDTDAWIYKMPNKLGYCGTPYLVSTQNGLKIVGIHVAGAPEEEISFMASLDYDSVMAVWNKYKEVIHVDGHLTTDAALQDVELQGCLITPGTQAIGTSKLSARLATQSKIFPTEFHPDSPKFDSQLDLGHVPTRAPVVMTGKGQVGKTLSKWQKCTPPISLPDLNFDFSHVLPRTAVISGCKPISIRESIFGCPGVDAMDATKSSGWPYVCQGRTRAQVMKLEGDLSPVFEKSVDDLREMLKERAVPMIVVDAVKDELVPFKSIEDGKVRIFQIGQLQHLVLYRMEMSMFWIELRRLPYETPFSAGLNPHSSQWGLLYKRLNGMRCSDGVLRFMAGDFKGHEFTLPAAYGYVFADMIDTLYPVEDEVRRTVRRNLIFSIIWPYHLHKHRIFKVDKGNSSGSGMTFIYGSTVSYLVFQAAWKYIVKEKTKKFENFVEMAITIDDTICTVRDTPEFNMISVAEYIEMVGMKYTSFDKREVSVPYLMEDEVDYLKRQFRMRQGFMFAPLTKASIYEAVMFGTGTSRSGNPRLDLLNTLRNMLIEAVHHGPEMYNKILQVARRWVNKESLSAAFPSYSNALGRMINDEIDQDGVSQEFNISPGQAI